MLNRPIIKLLLSKNYGLFYLGWAISLLGNNLSRVALPILIYQKTGSSLATGSAFALQELPSAIFGPLLGALADRWNRKLMIIFADIGRALLLLVIILVQDPPLIFASIFMIGILNALYFPVRVAILPEIVPRDLFPTVVSLHGATQQIAQIVGPSIAAIIISLTGPKLALVMDMISFAIGAIVTTMVFIPVQKTSKPNNIIVDIKDGVSYLLNNKLIRMLNFFWIILSFGFGGINVLLLFYLVEIKIETSYYGLLMSLITVGMFVGIVFGPKVKENYKRIYIFFTPVVFGLCFCILKFNIGFLGLLIIVTILGFLYGLFNVIASVIFGQNIPNEIRGRVYATATTFTTLAYSISSFSSGALEKNVKISNIFLIIGIIIVAISTIISLKHYNLFSIKRIENVEKKMQI
ncbi:MFS transporter [Bacillus sp. MHSD_36]|uniref:MFS transporter n=1 Tax=unclassified Bacillus (in: firmicutes) TaxID=185979 RepID=UPI0027414447|nr:MULTISPECIES: MFS transporter [unclassified Bacillus (in: firmicutes)]MDP7991392.1 MFS transporter [Bacillus sp. MHSD_36]MDR4980266.1 MFS transporter [Bacillus sp. MHSD_37]